MATIYGEAVLAQTYKTEVNGEVTGGPVYYIKAAFKGTFGKVLSTLFAVFIILALGFMGNMVQSNSIGAAFVEAFQVFHVELSPVIVGIVVAVIAAVIFLGGTKSLATVVEKIVPIMARCLYRRQPGPDLHEHHGSSGSVPFHYRGCVCTGSSSRRRRWNHGA